MEGHPCLFLGLPSPLAFFLFSLSPRELSRSGIRGQTACEFRTEVPAWRFCQVGCVFCFSLSISTAQRVYKCIFTMRQHRLRNSLLSPIYKPKCSGDTEEGAGGSEVTPETDSSLQGNAQEFKAFICLD